MRSSSLALILPLSLGLACDRGPVAPVARTDFVHTGSDAMYQLVGKALFPGAFVGAPRDLVVVIVATKSFDGRVAGYVISPFEQLRLSVTEVTPPSPAYPHWCLDVPPIPGSDVYRLYVRDNHPAMDQINFGSSATPGTCLNEPEPDVPEAWVTFVSGDIRGRVRSRP